MEDSSEVLLKYQKLALEYSKLKAQTSVLKSAIADEQATASELQENLKKKDQLIRKLEQEVECLNFRNVQLSKRVSVLQNDLEVVDASSKHSKVKYSSNSAAISPESYNVLNIELQSRIEENERLHKQVYTADLEHRNEIAELSSNIEQLRADLEFQEHKLGEKIKEQEELINGLQKEKIKLQVTIKNYEQEMKNRKLNEETKARDNSFAKEDLTLQLEEARAIIKDQVLFNDTCKDSLNLLNVPVVQRGKHEQLLSLMLKLQVFISDFIRQLSDLFTFMIQRLCSSSDSSIKPIVSKLELHLRESIQNLKIIPLSFENITSALKSETLAWDKSSVMEFSNIFQKHEKYLDKLLPFLILRIQNKDSWTGSSAKVIELVPKLVSLSRKLIYSFKKLYRYIQLLSFIGTDSCYATQPIVVQKILSNIVSLQILFDESRQLFGSKITMDHQLPMLSQSDKNTDECILSSLVSLSTTLKKMSDLMQKDLEVISHDIWYKPRNIPRRLNATLSPYVWQYKARGTKYMQQINWNDSPSIPYEMALKNFQTLQEHADNQENLTQQLELYRNKLTQLELDKENWMLECQLMKAKESRSPDVQSSGEMKLQDYDEIQLFVKTTVNRLIKQIQFADSKSIAFRNECETLHQKLKMSLHKKEQLENEIANAREVIERMKEEQKTLMQNYEDQLNTMSDHLANLNETLTAQKDEIDALKQAGNNKGSRKGKSK
ncbi:hypothetical protein X975_00948, partial [Stegodyphus mimosarum]